MTRKGRPKVRYGPIDPKILAAYGLSPGAVIQRQNEPVIAVVIRRLDDPIEQTASAVADAIRRALEERNRRPAGE